MVEWRNPLDTILDVLIEHDIDEEKARSISYSIFMRLDQEHGNEIFPGPNNTLVRCLVVGLPNKIAIQEFLNDQ